MGASSQMSATEKRRSFIGITPWEARGAASLWLSDFTEHGPLDLQSIRVHEEGDFFVAWVVYSEMAVESSPRYFEDRPLRKSA